MSVILLVDRTKDELGVEFKSLKDHSDTNVYVKCNICEEEFLRPFRRLCEPHSCPSHLIRDNINLKLCRHCNKYLPYSSFEIDSYRYDDLSTFCKSCPKLIPSCSDQIPIRLECKIINKDAKVPSSMRITDAGHDLYSLYDVTVDPNTFENIRTGVCLSAPPGYYYTIEGRSSMWRRGILPFSAIVDGTYTGELMVALFNLSDKPVTVSKHDRVAQLVIHKIYNIDISIVNDWGPDYNQRGDAGFGSSGR